MMAAKPSLSATVTKVAHAAQAAATSGPFAHPYRSMSRIAAGTMTGRASIAAASTSPISRASRPFASSQTGRNGICTPAKAKIAA